MKANDDTFYRSVEELHAINGGRRGRDCMVVGFKHCEFERRSGEVYLIQHYVIKIVSDLQQIFCFLRLLLFPPLIKLTAMI
jgi:hypothetical protein